MTLQCDCDYLEFTVPADRQADLLAALPGDVQMLDRGWRGYTNAGLLAGGKGRVGWSPERPEMGCHVSLGSQALDVLGVLDDRWADRPGVVELVQDDLEGHVTRFDAAFDDQGDVLDLDTIERALFAGEYTSRWKGGRVVKGFGGNLGGRTFYLGSPKSDAMLLIYDKAEERAAKGEPFDGDHWVRVELRLRRGRADAAASLFKRARDNASAVMSHLAGVLRGYIEFKVPNATDTNKRRWEPASWWLRFLGFVEKARLPVVADLQVKTLGDVQNWITAQVSPSLALLEEGMGFDQAWAFLFSEAQEGRHRWKSRHRAILAASGT